MQLCATKVHNNWNTPANVIRYLIIYNRLENRPWSTLSFVRAPLLLALMGVTNTAIRRNSNRYVLNLFKCIIKVNSFLIYCPRNQNSDSFIFLFYHSFCTYVVLYIIDLSISHKSIPILFKYSIIISLFNLFFIILFL